MPASKSNWNASWAVARVFALAPPLRAGDSDPAGMAREVFQGPEFWWKRIETKSMPKPPSFGLRWLLDAILKALGRAWDAFWRFIGAILRLLFGGFTGASSGGTLVVWLLAGLLLAWAIWKLLPLFLQWRVREAPRIRTDAAASEALPEAADLRTQSARAQREGRHAEAIRLALLALIAGLEQRGLLRYDVTRTNREYRAELRRRPKLAEGFGRLARIYEGVWYGREPASPEQSEESVRLCESLVDEEALSLE
jgi:hypothetical protein